MEHGKEIAMFFIWMFKCRKHNSSTIIIKTSMPQPPTQKFICILSFIFCNNPEKVLLVHLTDEITGTL